MSTPESAPLGPCKWKEISWITKNADPLLERNKKQKVTDKPAEHTKIKSKVKPAVKSRRTSTSCQSSVEIEEEEEDAANLVHQEPPTNPNCILEKADGSDNDPDDSPPQMDVNDDVDEEDNAQEEEPVEESTESKLGEFLIDVNQCGSQHRL